MHVFLKDKIHAFFAWNNKIKIINLEYGNFFKLRY